MIGGAETGEVDEVDGAWARDDVESKAEDDEGGTGEEVVLEVQPKVVEMLDQACGLGGLG